MGNSNITSPLHTFYLTVLTLKHHMKIYSPFNLW